MEIMDWKSGDTLTTLTDKTLVTHSINNLKKLCASVINIALMPTLAYV